MKEKKVKTKLEGWSVLTLIKVIIGHVHYLSLGIHIPLHRRYVISRSLRRRVDHWSLLSRYNWCCNHRIWVDIGLTRVLGYFYTSEDRVLVKYLFVVLRAIFNANWVQIADSRPMLMRINHCLRVRQRPWVLIGHLIVQEVAIEWASLATVLKDRIAGHRLSTSTKRSHLHRWSSSSSARAMIWIEVVAYVAILREDTLHHILVRAEWTLLLTWCSRNWMVLEATVVDFATGYDWPCWLTPIVLLLGEELSSCIRSWGANIVWELRKGVIHFLKLKGRMNVASLLPLTPHLLSGAATLAR